MVFINIRMRFVSHLYPRRADVGWYLRGVLLSFYHPRTNTTQPLLGVELFTYVTMQTFVFFYIPAVALWRTKREFKENGRSTEKHIKLDFVSGLKASCPKKQGFQDMLPRLMSPSEATETIISRFSSY